VGNPTTRLPRRCWQISLYQMSTVKLWIEGARLRTLPLAIAPIILGSATAASLDDFDLLLSVLALLVALSLQVGVNYANDYSDGIRGTDENRVGPLRLTGSGSAKPGSVKTAAFASFGFAGLVGLAIVLLTGQWFLVLIGVAAIIAAWFYTCRSCGFGNCVANRTVVFGADWRRCHHRGLVLYRR